jgi:hypothetical protein
MRKFPVKAGILSVGLYVSLIFSALIPSPAFAQTADDADQTAVDFSRSVAPIPPEAGSSVAEAIGDTVVTTLIITDSDENEQTDTEDAIDFVFEDDAAVGEPSFRVEIDADGTDKDGTILSAADYTGSLLEDILPALTTLQLSETGKTTGVFDEELEFVNGGLDSEDWQDLEVSITYINGDGVELGSCLVFRGNDGRVTAEPSIVKTGSILTITVEDGDLNLDDNEIDHFDSGDLGPAALLLIETEDEEIVGGVSDDTFVETGEDTRIFTATFVIGEDIQISELDGDQVEQATNILITYEDEIDSTGGGGDEVEVNVPVVSSTGSIQVTPQLVGPATQLTILIVDADLDEDATSIDEYTVPAGQEDTDDLLVSFASDRNEVGEASPDLEETGANTGVFMWTLELITDETACQDDDLDNAEFQAEGSDTDATIGACPGDLISIRYEDEATGDGGSTTVSEVVEVQSFDPEFAVSDDVSAGERVDVIISDPDANRDPDIADSLTDIRVRSDSDQVGEEFSALETGRDTGVFRLSFGTTTGTASGAISVKNGDYITVIYTDDFPADFEEEGDIDFRFFFRPISKTAGSVSSLALPTDAVPLIVTASPVGGTYKTAQSIKLAANKHCTTIYYTTDESTPTASSKVYTSPISLSTNATLKFFAMDIVGNSGGMISAEYVIIDTPPPKASALPPGGSYTSTQLVVLTADEPAVIYYTSDGSPPTESSTVYSLPISVSTATTLIFFAKDLDGNFGALQTEVYTIDSAVQATITINSNDEYTNDRSVTLSIECDNSTVRTSKCFEMRVSADGIPETEVFEPFNASKNLTLAPEDGIKTVVVQFRTEENTFFGASDKIILDTEAPAPPTITSLKDDYINDKHLLITGDAEQGAQIQVFDRNTPVAGTQANSPWSTTLDLVDGEHTLTATAKDRAGNVSPRSSPLRFTIDTNLPRGNVSINSGESETYSSTVMLSLACSDDTTWCSKMKISTDGKIDTELEENYTTEQIRLPAGEGLMTVHVQYVDAAGNNSPELFDDISVIPPALKMTINNKSPLAGLDQVTVEGTLTAGGTSSPAVRIDWGDGGVTWPHSAGGLWEDTHIYSAGITGETRILASLFDDQNNPLEIEVAEVVVVRPFPIEIVAGIASVAVAGTVIIVKKPELIMKFIRSPEIVFDYGLSGPAIEIVVKKDQPEISYFSDLDRGMIAGKMADTIIEEFAGEQNIQRNFSYIKEFLDMKRTRNLSSKTIASRIWTEAVGKLCDKFVNNYFTSQFVKGISYQIEVSEKKASDTAHDESKLKLQYKNHVIKFKQNVDTMSIEPYVGVALQYPPATRKIPIFRIIFSITSGAQIGAVEFERELDGKKKLKLKDLIFNLNLSISGLYFAPFDNSTAIGLANKNLIKSPIKLRSREFKIDEISILGG